MTKTYSIYGLIDPRDMKVFYIGKTSRLPNERYNEHIKETSGRTLKQKRIQEIYEAKYLPPDLVVLEGGIKGPKLAFTKEVYWIEVFRMSGTVLTNASVDYDGVYFLTDNHLATVRKVGRWSVDIAAHQSGDFELKEVHLTDDEIESEQVQFKSAESIASNDGVRLMHELEPLLARNERVVGELMEGLESGRWQGGDAVLVATKLKEQLEKNGSWLPKFKGSNKLKKKKHERTLKVIDFLRLSEK